MLLENPQTIFKGNKMESKHILLTSWKMNGSKILRGPSCVVGPFSEGVDSGIWLATAGFDCGGVRLTENSPNPLIFENSDIDMSGLNVKAEVITLVNPSGVTDESVRSVP